MTGSRIRGRTRRVVRGRHLRAELPEPHFFFLREEGGGVKESMDHGRLVTGYIPLCSGLEPVRRSHRWLDWQKTRGLNPGLARESVGWYENLAAGTCRVI